MRNKKRIALAVGTRPEAIKMAPVYFALQRHPDVEVRWISTGQHREMLDQVLQLFGIKPDVDLALMRNNQSLPELTGRILASVQGVLTEMRPSALLVHGDTTTCLAASLAAFYERVPVGHVEAGLRTYDYDAPWPEEMNRRLTDAISQWCFAPTSAAAENLRCERVPARSILVTGNTVIDALLLVRQKARDLKAEVKGLPAGAVDGKRLVLVTGHRRESFGRGVEQLCRALLELIEKFPDLAIAYPVHLNPNIAQPVFHWLGNRDRIYLLPPADYVEFVALMDRSYLVITDSGGVQEEAPSLNKPVLVTRNTTERPEAVEAGAAILVGGECHRIVAEASRLLEDPEAYDRMRRIPNPYGDGDAASRIAERLVGDISAR